MVQCDWNNPGVDPARSNDVAAMIASYDYPKSDVAILVEKIRTANNDGVVVITKNGLIGLSGTASNLSDMHFRNGKCHGLVNVDKWPLERQESALVYCSNDSCVAIPVICGNISRITWKPRTKNYIEVEKYEISEPSTLLLLALAGLALLFRKTKGQRHS